MREQHFSDSADPAVKTLSSDDVLGFSETLFTVYCQFRGKIFRKPDWGT